MSPTIRGRFSMRPTVADYAPCAWCGDLTSFWMETPGRPEIGELPLHALCSAEIVSAYSDFLAGRFLPEATTLRLRALTVGESRAQNPAN